MLENITFLLKYVNILIILYSIGFAARFLSLTVADSDRKPWEYLTFAVIILFFLQVFEFLKFEMSELLTQIITLILTTLLLVVFMIQDFHMKKKNFETLSRKNSIPVDKR